MTISNEQVATLPNKSANSYVTVVVPTSKDCPEIWLLVTVTSPDSSVAVGEVQVTGALMAPLGAVTKMADVRQPLMTGAVSSMMTPP